MTLQAFIEETFPVLCIGVLIFGACVGSFLNVVICRLPVGKSIINPPSSCPVCGHQIRFWENIPLLSWIWLKGRCSECKASISLQYPMVEGLTSLLFLFIFLFYYYRDFNIWGFIVYLYLAAATLAVAWVDAKWHKIPNRITYSGVVVGVGVAILAPKLHLDILGGGRHYVQSVFQRFVPSESFVSIFDESSLRALALMDSLTAACGLVIVLSVIAVIGKYCWANKWEPREETFPINIQSHSVDANDTLNLPENVIPGTVLHVSDLTVWKSPESGKAEKEYKVLNVPEAQVKIYGNLVKVGKTRFQKGEFSTIHARVLGEKTPQTALGGGDIKFFAMLGALFGLKGVIYILCIASFTACVYGVCLMFYNNSSRLTQVPFGPFAMLAAWGWMFIGPLL